MRFEGKPGTRVKHVPDGNRADHTECWLGLDVGGTKLLGVAVKADRTVIAREQARTVREQGPEAVIERCVALCRRLITKAGTVAGVGVGFAGLIEPETGTVRSSVMLPGWHDVSLAERLTRRLEVPVVVENDATAAGTCEFQSLGEPASINLILLTVGTGIGGAIYVDGRPLRGRSGLAGEFGNTSIAWHGPRCWCGSRGCLNMLASGSAMTKRAAELVGEFPGSRLSRASEPLTLELIAAAALLGDQLARRVVQEGAQALGAGIANLVNIFNPDRVSLCGGVLALGDDYLQQVRESVQSRALAESMLDVSINVAVLGAESGAVGAALTAMIRVGSEECAG